MTPVELQAALARVHARSAQILSHRLLEGLSRDACAALYGLTPEQWDVIFLRAVNELEQVLGRPPSPRLTEALTPDLNALAEQRDAVKALIQKAHADYEASPAYATETWLRRIAIVVIIALTAYFWWRDKQNEKPVPYAPYLTQPKKP